MKEYEMKVARASYSGLALVDNLRLGHEWALI